MVNCAVQATPVLVVLAELRVRTRRCRVAATIRAPVPVAHAAFVAGARLFLAVVYLAPMPAVRVR